MFCQQKWCLLVGGQCEGFGRVRCLALLHGRPSSLLCPHGPQALKDFLWQMKSILSKITYLPIFINQGKTFILAHEARGSSSTTIPAQQRGRQLLGWPGRAWHCTPGSWDAPQPWASLSSCKVLGLRQQTLILTGLWFEIFLSLGLKTDSLAKPSSGLSLLLAGFSVDLVFVWLLTGVPFCPLFYP